VPNLGWAQERDQTGPLWARIVSVRRWVSFSISNILMVLSEEQVARRRP